MGNGSLASLPGQNNSLELGIGFMGIVRHSAAQERFYVSKIIVGKSATAHTRQCDDREILVNALMSRSPNRSQTSQAKIIQHSLIIILAVCANIISPRSPQGGNALP